MAAVTKRRREALTLHDAERYASRGARDIAAWLRRVVGANDRGLAGSGSFRSRYGRRDEVQMHLLAVVVAGAERASDIAARLRKLADAVEADAAAP